QGPISELATRFGVHQAMIQQWKRALPKDVSGVFEIDRNPYFLSYFHLSLVPKSPGKAFTK
ncbi:MAG: hypothetical protein KUG70_01935, partial [Rhodobacteraceae bacterium]|nr:hypothetical protein [Paracoccaceae bacterium]